MEGGKMSDTPETDSLREAIDNGAATEAEMTSLAGKLETELVAQEERMAAAGQRCGLAFWEYGMDWPDIIADELLRTREERDKAQGELEMWRDGNILYEIHKDELEKVERERDQARRELDIQLESITFHMERVPVRDHPLRADDAKLDLTTKEGQ